MKKGVEILLKLTKKIAVFSVVAGIITTSACATRLTNSDIEKIPDMFRLLEKQTYVKTTIDEIEPKINHLLFGSTFCAIDGEDFPYFNSLDYTETVDDGTYVVDEIWAKGCYAYAKFAAYLIYNDFGTSRLYHKETKGALTSEGVKKFLLKNAQTGEHIRLGNYHSVSFVSGDNKGFYCLEYISDNNPKIALSYYTYPEFLSILNKAGTESGANGRILSVFNTQKEVNKYYDYPETLSVILDNNLLEFDVNPEIIESRTYIPLRVIAEKMGAEISWNEETKTAVAVKGENTAEFTIGNKNVKINGELVRTDSAPVVKDSRTLVPLRTFANALKCKVGWEEETKCVLIDSPVEKQEEEKEAEESVSEE